MASKSFSVNLSVEEWKRVKEVVEDFASRNFLIDGCEEECQTIMKKIDKKQRAKQNLENNITRKNKLIKSLENEISECHTKMEELEKTIANHDKELQDDSKLYTNKINGMERKYKQLEELYHDCFEENKLNAEASKMKSKDINELYNMKSGKEIKELKEVIEKKNEEIKVMKERIEEYKGELTILVEPYFNELKEKKDKEIKELKEVIENKELAIGLYEKELNIEHVRYLDEQTKVAELKEMINEQSDVNEKLEEELMDQKKICQELLWAKENKPK